jgi:capsular exopolysaccharide synthesis family protein
VVVVTSPHPAEGKSTIAVNLATALAQDGRRVVLMDCDLRKPRLHQVFRLASAPGLTSYLTGSATKAEIIMATEMDQLRFIPAGPVPPTPAELLNSQTFKDLLGELRREFHHLIIDTPPTLGFADARVMSVQADGVLLVAKHYSTSREAGRLTRQLFSQVNARLLGMVLNQVDTGSLALYDHCYQKYYDRYYGQDHKSSGGCGPGEESPQAKLH